MDLHQHWATVEERLRAARRILPVQLIEELAEGSAERFLEWLDANELELALDELAGLGELNTAPAPFWAELYAAAQQMGLVEHASKYAQRMRG
jgi:hypothetical protein